MVMDLYFGSQNKTKTVDNKKTVMYDFLGFAAEKEKRI